MNDQSFVSSSGISGLFLSPDPDLEQVPSDEDRWVERRVAHFIGPVKGAAI